MALACAIESIKAGSDIALVVGAEVQNTTTARQGAEYLARASHFKRQSTLDDFVFPAMFARRTRACFEHGVATPQDLAMLSMKAYGNANKNPLAHMHKVVMSMDTALTASDKNPNFLGNAELKPFLKTSDCSQVSDGSAGMIIASEEGLKKLQVNPHDCIEFLGLGHATGNLYVDSDPTHMSTTAAAACHAFKDSGISVKDIDVVELHDCFSITEILMMEALGFAPKVCRCIGRSIYRHPNDLSDSFICLI
jgi:acetyl-CoA acyltransferase